MEITRGLITSSSGLPGLARPAAPADSNADGSSKAVQRVVPARTPDSGSAEAQARTGAMQALPVAVRARAGQLMTEPPAPADIARAGLGRAAVGAEPGMRARLAVAQYRQVAGLEERMALVEMMGIDTFA